MKDRTLEKFQLQAEIDYWHYVLAEMFKASKKGDVISRMIDDATGYDKVQLKKAKRIIVKVEKLKERFYNL